MMGKANGFLIPYIFRPCAVMLKDDMPKLTGQSTLDKIDGQQLVIGHEIMLLIIIDENGGESILILIPENIHDTAAVFVQFF